MRRVPTTNERERNAAFLHGFQGDINICTILKDKILHSVYHEQCYSTRRKGCMNYNCNDCFWA